MGTLGAVADPQLKKPWPLLVYTGCLVAAAVAIGYVAHQFPYSFPLTAIAWFALLATIAEAMPVLLPRGGAVTVGFAVDMASVFLFGALPAAVIAGTGAVMAAAAHRRAADIVVFNGALLFLAVGVAGIVWQSLGGTAGVVPRFSTELFAVFASALTYFLLNATLACYGIALERERPFRSIWTPNVMWTIPNFLTLAVLGMLVAITYHSSLGALGTAFIWFPLFLARYTFQQYTELKNAHLQTIQALSAALEAKDEYTRGHSDRVADVSVRLGRALGLGENELEIIRYGGLMHDIGKIGVQEAILKKTGRLTEEEYSSVKLHPVIGSEMVKPIGFLKEVGAIIRHHHERWDGAGYPDGLKGEDIPLGARIMAVCDAFDAMTSTRTYRQGRSASEAVAELRANRGTQFDPQVVDAFLEHVWPGLEAEGYPDRFRPAALTEDIVPALRAVRPVHESGKVNHGA